MEKTVVIDGQEVLLKVTARCFRLYKAQFGRDLIKDIYSMKKLEKFIVDGGLEMTDEAVALIDFEMFSNLLWVFAKKADPTIPSPDVWEDQFVSMPFRDIFPEILELLTVLLDGVKK